MGRWKYPTETVSVGANSQNVRCLTAAERSAVMAAQKALEKGDIAGMTKVQMQIARAGSVDPELTEEDVQTMPSSFLDAVAAKVMELTGEGQPDEKKDASTGEPQAS